MDDLRREGGEGNPPDASADRPHPQHPESPLRRARLQRRDGVHSLLLGRGERASLVGSPSDEVLFHPLQVGASRGGENREADSRRPLQVPSFSHPPLTPRREERASPLRDVGRRRQRARQRPRRPASAETPPPKSAPFRRFIVAHSESYNPPEEYLLSDAEKRAWETADPADRETNYLPAKFACLRRVPLYPAGVRERYERCLDLYLAPRSLKRKLTLDRNALLPQLPSLSELRPFPTTQTAQLAQMAQRVRAVAIDASGYYVAIGDEGQGGTQGVVTCSACGGDNHGTRDETVEGAGRRFVAALESVGGAGRRVGDGERKSGVFCGYGDEWERGDASSVCGVVAQCAACG